MKFRVFYNKDCAMWGIQEYINTGYKLYGNNGYKYIKKWIQIVPLSRQGKHDSAYTPYKGVASRWIKELVKE